MWVGPGLVRNESDRPTKHGSSLSAIRRLFPETAAPSKLLRLRSARSSDHQVSGTVPGSACVVLARGPCGRRRTPRRKESGSFFPHMRETRAQGLFFLCEAIQCSLYIAGFSVHSFIQHRYITFCLSSAAHFSGGRHSVMIQ